MELKEIEAKVKDFLVEEFEIDEDKIAADARLKEDLGIDSLEVVDIVVLVEQTFGYKIKSEDFASFKTFSEFCAFIQSKIA